MGSVEIWTDGGSRANRGPEGQDVGGWGTYVKGDGRDPYTVYGGRWDYSNNQAELRAYEQACREVLANGWSKVKFYLDSKYVMDNARFSLDRWIASDWKTKVGTDVKNRDQWEQIYTLQKELKAQNVSLAYQWVKGHSGVYGNEMADEYAGAAMDMLLDGVHLEDVNYVDNPKLQIELIEEARAAAEELAETQAAPAKPEKKPKAKKEKLPQPNPFICGRRLVDLSNTPQIQTHDGRFVYMTTTFNTKAAKQDEEDEAKKKEAKTRNLGVPDPDVLEGVVIARHECPYYKSLREMQNTLAVDNADFPFMVAWDRFTTKAFWDKFVKEGTALLEAHEHEIYIRNKAKDPELTFYLRVPRLARDAIDSCMTKVALLDRFQNGELEADTQDITDYFFEADKKGNLVAKASLQTDRLVTIPTEFNGKAVDVHLTQNIDVPMRAAMGRMGKEEGGVKVYLVKHVKTTTTFRYTVIVAGKDNIAAYNCPGANIRLVP